MTNWEVIIGKATKGRTKTFKTWTSIETFLNEHEFYRLVMAYCNSVCNGKAEEYTGISQKMYKQFFAAGAFPDTLMSHACVLNHLRWTVEKNAQKAIITAALSNHEYDLLDDSVSRFVGDCLQVNSLVLQQHIYGKHGIDITNITPDAHLKQFLKKRYFVDDGCADHCYEQVICYWLKTLLFNLSLEECKTALTDVKREFGNTKYEMGMKRRIDEQINQFDKELSLTVFISTILRDILAKITHDTFLKYADDLIMQSDRHELSNDDKCTVLQFILDTREGNDRTRFDAIYFVGKPPELSLELRKEFAEYLIAQKYGEQCSHIMNQMIDTLYQDRQSNNTKSRKVIMNCDSTTLSRQANHAWRVPQTGSMTPNNEQVYLSLSPYCDQCYVHYKNVCGAGGNTSDCINRRLQHSYTCVTPDHGEAGHIGQVAMLRRAIRRS